ncbi:MAG: PHP domain-containing protein [Candidatus Omnitrophica bacterium]|nr:PHP domain-containing protein [Candidatus Omnitrophota bacterium]MBU1925845.1 PHP domain-containing protein [Candidatus Omnitrophota bacterium]
MKPDSKRFVDLHVHTNFSDSSLAPREVVEIAQNKGLSAVAITDHDCVDGILPAQEAAQGMPLEIIPGIELTSENEEREIHIIGLFIDWQQDWFGQKLEQIRQFRTLRMKEMIGRLKENEVDIAEEDVFSLSTTSGSVGRLHLARALLAKGAVNSIKQAFAMYIGENSCCYVKRMRIAPQEAIAMIKKLGGIPILAHPGMQNCDELIVRLLPDGLMGIEVFHINHTPREVHYYSELAKKYNLLVSGGSDCHGEGKGLPFIGKVRVPYHVLESLKQAAAAKNGEERQ